MRKTQLERLTDQIVKRIVQRFHPERIILFGSAVRGNATPDSDLDLPVVVPVEGLKREKQLAIRKSLRGIQVPVDIIVSTPEEFGWRRKIVGTIEYPAVREGKVLYVRP